MSYKPKVRLPPLGVIGRDLLVDNEEEKMSESTRDETKNTQTDFAVGDVHSKERRPGARADLPVETGGLSLAPGLYGTSGTSAGCAAVSIVGVRQGRPERADAAAGLVCHPARWASL